MREIRVRKFKALGDMGGRKREKSWEIKSKREMVWTMKDAEAGDLVISCTMG